MDGARNRRNRGQVKHDVRATNCVRRRRVVANVRVVELDTRPHLVQILLEAGEEIIDDADFAVAR